MIKINLGSKLKPYYSYALIGDDFYESSEELQTRKFIKELPIGTLYAFIGSTPSTPSDFDVTIFRKQFEIESSDNMNDFLFYDCDEEAFQMLCTPGKLLEKIKELKNNTGL